MKIEVWTKQHSRDVVNAKLIWVGELGCIPREGEYLSLYSGWASKRIETVTYHLDDNVVTIVVGPDYLDEYPEVTTNE